MRWSEKWGYVSPFLTILALHVLAIFFFTRGFLLTRTELSAYSSCSDIFQSPCSNPAANFAASDHENPTATPDANVTHREVHHPDRADGNVCWTRPAVDRLIIIVLDALRFDFVAPSTFFDEPKPWMDKLMVLQKLASTFGSSARIFKAIADPPTTSLQRLKGLTTGGLPTFIDVGNSFGAPAIVEDNLLHQLSSNGKRVLMMGDDTWLQLFPSQFEKSYPYPSFNVKDLDTVDNGCIEHLFPSLYKDDWDVLIAHFLGVDHAGHIYGVDSVPMIQKLEQYNNMIEQVVEVLKSLSGPGGLHENTFLIVMGDHGQTTNGDHGGGTAEEVETALFAMSFSDTSSSTTSILDSSSCRLNRDGEKICASSIQQIDFSVTIAALLGIPFPFGSIGRVNPELYALIRGTFEGAIDNQKTNSNLVSWMKNYVDTLCINCWQVKRYIDLYSAASLIGFPSEDMNRLSVMYNNAQKNWLNIMETNLAPANLSSSGVETILRKQIATYSNFLESVAALARSKWTEFDLKMMGLGFGIFLVSFLFQLRAIVQIYKSCWSVSPCATKSWSYLNLLMAMFLVVIRANSFLSNSYILAEGKVANFLLATAGIFTTRCLVIDDKNIFVGASFLALNIILRFNPESGLFKHVLGSAPMSWFSTDNTQSDSLAFSVFMVEVTKSLPIFVLLLLVFLLLKKASAAVIWDSIRIFVSGAILSYLLTALHWISESSPIPTVAQKIGTTFIPRAVYLIGFILLIFAIFQRFRETEKKLHPHRKILTAIVSMLCAWSPTVLILLGRQGPIVASVLIVGVWCILKLQQASNCSESNGAVNGLLVNPLSITKWSLFAVCLFFLSGHWCTFDGLRYGAAFIGFDHFNLIRQGFLLGVDTFGVSHILPALALPFLVPFNNLSQSNQASRLMLSNLCLVFLIYGLITATTTTLTILCVTIQRRHLMVWGLFAPKFVFDAVGLLLTDIFIFLASLYYF